MSIRTITPKIQILWPIASTEEIYLNQSPPGSNSGGFWRLNPWGRDSQKYLWSLAIRIEQPPTSTQSPNGGLIMAYDYREKTDLLTPSTEHKGYFSCPSCGKHKFGIDEGGNGASCLRVGCTPDEIRRAIDQLEGKSEWRPEQSKGLDKKVEIGFANIDTKFAKLEGKIDTVEAKLDERTKLGFWGFIFRGTALAALATLTAIFVKYLFPILPTAMQQ